MVKHHDTLIYYKEMGGIDSTSIGLIASVSKTFSGITILKLAQEGFFNLDDSLGKYKPMATTYGKGSNTIRQNFSHTGGWLGITDYHEDNNLSLQQAADSIIQNDPLLYEPGQAFLYGGVSMHLAASIAEISTGESWRDLFQTKIAQPINLNQSSYCLGNENPRIAGGMCSSPSDLMKLAEFIRTNGKNKEGISIVDSVWMAELWKDQTFKAPQLIEIYPFQPIHNNPYQADTIYYGFGNWLDIYNPNTHQQEQISAAGAFGTVVWINRCHNLTGVIFTKPPSSFSELQALWYEIMDEFRNALPYTCHASSVTQTTTQTKYVVYPNPSLGLVHINNPKLAHLKIEIRNSNGQNVDYAESDNALISLHLNSKQKGLYYIIITTKKEVVVQKITLI